MGQSAETIHQQRVRFEEVTPAHEYAAFFGASLESLVAHLDLPVFEGYDDLDNLRLAFFTLKSGETVTLGEYLNSPQPGTSLYVDSAMENIPQIVFDSCQQLQISKQEIVWLHPNFKGDIDYSEYESIKKRQKSSLFAHRYEPINCLNYALQIYTRQDYPLYWAMLQHNLGLAYFNRSQGDRKENLEKSIKCFNCSLEIYTQKEFPEKWKINQDDLNESMKSLQLLSKLIEYQETVTPVRMEATLKNPLQKCSLSIRSRLSVPYLLVTFGLGGLSVFLAYEKQYIPSVAIAISAVVFALSKILESLIISLNNKLK